jgi:hypothetical protein
MVSRRAAVALASSGRVKQNCGGVYARNDFALDLKGVENSNASNRFNVASKVPPDAADALKSVRQRLSSARPVVSLEIHQRRSGSLRNSRKPNTPRLTQTRSIGGQ